MMLMQIESWVKKKDTPIASLFEYEDENEKSRSRFLGIRRRLDERVGHQVIGRS